MKVKVAFQRDLIAIQIPSDISLQQLKDKLVDRLKVDEEILLSYKDERTGNYYNLNSDRDLDAAIQHNTKLTLYVDVA